MAKLKNPETHRYPTTREIGAKGGRTTLERYGTRYFSRIGRLGGRPRKSPETTGAGSGNGPRVGATTPATEKEEQG